jgi:hypothetical protein
MPFHEGIFPIEGDGVEIQIERLSGKELVSLDLLVPSSQELGGVGVVDPRGILRQVTLFRGGVESGKQSESFIGY